MNTFESLKQSYFVEEKEKVKNGFTFGLDRDQELPMKQKNLQMTKMHHFIEEPSFSSDQSSEQSSLSQNTQLQLAPIIEQQVQSSKKQQQQHQIRFTGPKQLNEFERKTIQLKQSIEAYKNAKHVHAALVKHQKQKQSDNFEKSVIDIHKKGHSVYIDFGEEKSKHLLKELNQSPRQADLNSISYSSIVQKTEEFLENEERYALIKKDLMFKLNLTDREDKKRKQPLSKQGNSIELLNSDSFLHPKSEISSKKQFIDQLYKQDHLKKYKHTISGLPQHQRHVSPKNIGVSSNVIVVEQEEDEEESIAKQKEEILQKIPANKVRDRQKCSLNFLLNQMKVEVTKNYELEAINSTRRLLLPSPAASINDTISLKSSQKLPLLSKQKSNSIHEIASNQELNNISILNQQNSIDLFKQTPISRATHGSFDIQQENPISSRLKKTINSSASDSIEQSYYNVGEFEEDVNSFSSRRSSANARITLKPRFSVAAESTKRRLSLQQEEIQKKQKNQMKEKNSSDKNTLERLKQKKYHESDIAIAAQILDRIKQRTNHVVEDQNRINNEVNGYQYKKVQERQEEILKVFRQQRVAESSKYRLELDFKNILDMFSVQKPAESLS